MTRKFPAASKLAMLLAAAALVAFGSASASAQSKQKYDRDGRPYYGANGPNRSYQQGPRTRVYVTTRSWLCLLYTSPSPRDGLLSRMPSSA